MASEPAYIRNLKQFTRSLSSADVPKVEEEFYGASDRASAVMLASMIESVLDSMLRWKVRPNLNASDRTFLFEHQGPIATFSAKIAVAYAFGLIGPRTRGDLDLVRILRNEFAHSRRSFGFYDPPVADVCQRLRTPDLPGSFVPNQLLFIAPPGQAAANNMSNPRSRFIVTCHAISDKMFKQMESLRPQMHDPPELP